MAHESFEDADTAAVMNELFVNIKVDREERPDIDQIYMSALHHLGEQGGWPLTMFLTPKGEPVWGGTYFPKTSRYGRPAFVDVLREVSRLFREEPDKIGQNRDALMERLASQARPAGKVTIGTHELDQLARQIGGAFDPTHGGLRGAPKFPNAAMYELVWRAGTADRRQAVFRADRAHAGAHLRGRHLRPSRRRLLALLGRRALARAAFREDALRQRPAPRAAGAGLCAQPATRCSASARPRRSAGSAREMTTPDGAFSASLDADSEGEEGKFYVWSKAEVVEALGAENAAFFVQHYDVTERGQFRGPQYPQPTQYVTAQHGGRGAARHAAGQASYAAQQTGAARPRRQGAGRLERPDDRGAGQCRDHAGRAGLDRHGRAGLRVHCAQHDQGRPARPFLARGPAALSGARLRLRQHDPGGAGAVRGDRAGRLSRAGAGLAAGLRRALRQSGQRRLFPHRGRRRGPGGAAGLDQRRRHPQSEFDRRAEPRPARGADRRRRMARAGRPAVRRRAGRRGATICCSMPRCSTRSICGCTPPRSCHRAGPCALRRGGAEAAVPQSDHPARAGRRGIAGEPSGAGQDRGAGRASAAFVCVGETCSLPVTDPDKIADVVSAMRPAAASSSGTRRYSLPGRPDARRGAAAPGDAPDARARARCLRARLRLGLRPARRGRCRPAPQHRDPGGDVFARRGLGVAVGERREAKLDELVVPGRDAEVAVLRLGAIAGQVERRALEARALGRVVDGEVPPQIDLGVEPARLRQERIRPHPLEFGAHDRRLGVVGDRGALEIVDEDVELPAGLGIVQAVTIARLDLLEIGRIVEREAFDLFGRLEPEHIDRRNPERRHRRGGTKNQREQCSSGRLASGVHRLEEFSVALGVAQLVEQEVNRIHGSHRVKNAPQHVHFLEHGRVGEQLLLAGAGAGDVHRREGALVGDLSVENKLGIAGALELFEDDFVHAAAGVDQRGGDDGERAAFLDVARGAEEALRPLQRVGVDAAGQHLAG